MNQEEQASQQSNIFLLAGAGLSLIASLLHIAIVFGGPEWYRFFGAGEEMARLAEQGSVHPIIVTLFIALVLAIWSGYALSGAGMIRRLPLLKIALVVISAVYFLRGAGGLIMLPFLSDADYQVMGQSDSFMWISSLICLLFAFCYIQGTRQFWRVDKLAS